MIKRYKITVQNNMGRSELYDVQLEAQNAKKSSKWYQVFYKIVFALVCIGYIIMLALSFISINEGIKFLMSLFMGWLSVFLSAFFSNILGLFMEKKCQYKILINDEVNNLLLLLLSIFSAFIVWIACIKISLIYNYIYMNSDIGNVLTWLSLLIFFFDKNINI